MKNIFRILKAGVWGGVFVFLSLFASANNVRITGIVNVTAGTGDTLVLSFPLRWDNSWRDQFNWDAVWVFFKYKSGTGGWNHVNLCSGGHGFVNGSGQPVPFESMPGTTGSGTVGLFVYRNTLETGNTPEIMCQVKCLRSSLGNLTPQQFVNHESFVLAQVVEMVYVPYGVYALGDGECSNRFAGGKDGGAVWMDNEGLLNASSQVKVYPVVNNAVGSALTIAANYPKGYKGFYVMKYEVSQEQYVSFLNTLTYVQQQERIPGLTSLKTGEFIFGGLTTRNGIIVSVVSDGSSPVVFANNLNNNTVYSEDGDGKTIACNYLSPLDMITYCSWSGLRPMSELEYEKASRALYPDGATRGGYAWNTTVLNTVLSGVSNGGTRKETAQGGGNVNSGSGWGQGPVRCGIFATHASTQEEAGASFWGMMELSGNLREMCYNVNGNGAFNGTVLGDGTYSTNKWSATPSYIGVRGGSFAGSDSLLRSSDRTEINYFSSLTVNTHDSTVGFRAVRPIGDVAVTQGNLIAKQEGIEITDIACPNVQLELTTDVPAKVLSGGSEVPNMDFTYIWYVKKPGATEDVIIPGATGAVLKYSDLVVTGTTQTVAYQFKRKAICPMGDVTTLLTLTLLNMSIILNPLEVSIDACGGTKPVTARAYCDSPVFTWEYGEKLLSNSATYIPNSSDFAAIGEYSVTCKMSVGGCESSKELKVKRLALPPVQTFVSCGDNVLDCNGNRYPTLQIGTQCWMGKNLNVGSYQASSSSDYWKFDEPGIQKWCYNALSNCSTYGGLYEWWEAVCGGMCNGDVTVGNAEALTLNSESDLVAYGAKMVSGSTTQVQGICPDGWHMPSDGDWTVLEEFMGISDAGTTTGWLGTDQGMRMKRPGTFNGYNWCSGAACNSSKLGMLPGGLRDFNGSASCFYLGFEGYWWSSTPYGNKTAWVRLLNYSSTGVYRSSDHNRSYGLSIRCIAN